MSITWQILMTGYVAGVWSTIMVIFLVVYWLDYEFIKEDEIKLWPTR